MRGSVNEVMEYLHSKKKVIRVEEVSAKGADQHVRLFIDIDHVPNNGKSDLEEMSKQFLHRFASLFLDSLQNEYKKFEVKIYSTLTVDEICEGAAVAVKGTVGLETCIHI